MSHTIETIMRQQHLDMLLKQPVCLGKDCDNWLAADCWYFCRECGKTAMNAKKTVDKKIAFHASCATCDNRPPTRTGVCSLCTAAYPEFASTFMLRRMEFWWKSTKQVVKQSVFMRRWLGFEISNGDDVLIKRFLRLSIREAVEWKRRQRLRKQRHHTRKRKIDLLQRKHQKQQIEMKELLETHAQASVDENDAERDLDRMWLSWNHVKDETDRQQWERGELICMNVPDWQSLLDVNLQLDIMLQHEYEVKDSILHAVHVLEDTMRSDELVQNERDLILS